MAGSGPDMQEQKGREQWVNGWGGGMRETLPLLAWSGGTFWCLLVVTRTSALDTHPVADDCRATLAGSRHGVLKGQSIIRSSSKRLNTEEGRGKGGGRARKGRSQGLELEVNAGPVLAAL